MDDTSYKGASLSAKELLSWRPLRHSADVELDGELSTLVARSRDLIRNNGIASGAIQTLVDNVVGNGLKLVSIPDHRILGLDLDYLEEWARKVESLWRIWSESVYCDAARKLNFNSQTALIFRSVIENGEALALVLWRENQANQFATCFQLIEPDRLSNPDFKQNTEFLRDGIEINHYGEPQNYWISKYYPNDYYYHGNTNSWEKVAAQTSFGRKLILHIHHPERIGQNRGKPLFTSIMPLFKMLDHYERSELTNEPWATTSDTLENIINIAQRQNANPAAIAAQLGRKLQNTYAVSIRNNVAIIPIRGPLFRYANIFTAISGATSYELLARDFNSALVDESVKAILFDIDSPGGEVNGCSELADMIYSARGKKPIIAYASGNCCSGAYWIAAACDEIVVTDTAVVGSIGVVAVYEREDDKNKIEIVSSQSPLKRINPDTPEGQSKLQARLDTLAEVFINKIATYRDTSTETVIKDFGQGDVFIGRKAIWQGLANRQSSFERILTDLNKEKEDDDMNENDIKQRERQRIKEVLVSEHAQGREKVANKILLSTDLSSSQIIDILQEIPKEQPLSSFEKAMAQVPNPQIVVSGEEQGENIDVMAKRIASLAHTSSGE